MKIRPNQNQALFVKASFLCSSSEKFCVAAFFFWNCAAAAARQSVDGARSDLRFTKMRHRDTGAGWSEPQRYSSSEPLRNSSQSVWTTEIQTARVTYSFSLHCTGWKALWNWMLTLNNEYMQNQLPVHFILVESDVLNVLYASAFAFNCK